MSASPSAPPPARGGTNGSGSTSTSSKLSRNATPAEQQAAALQRLLAKPDREIKIPERKPEGVTKTLRAPRDMMKNVQGSSAGAGSGEFHVYKQSRRREYERLKIMDEEEEFARQKQEALERQAAYEREAEERTAKNRLKRQRKKGNHHRATGSSAASPTTANSGSGSGAAGGGEDGAMKKRKLAAAGGGAAFVFKTAEERDASPDPASLGPAGDARDEVDSSLAGHDSVDGGDGRTVQEADGAAAEQVRPAQEAGIVIQDDD
ncbi:hypothetical protein BMF94_3013 [Rhodotorula taiwanensis]|uniref:DUF1168-domain-containing protein n=1 Tax=Rhodotorula taiwanensis TaxID=741276 RepID=A0A2S5BB21_9BASI|nr:hypothetical protein BMF94_3013 [Rhodotorula taiwanensis]